MQNGTQTSLLEFAETVDRITETVVRCLEENIPFDERLKKEPISIYIKSSEMRVLYSNDAYRSVFAPDSIPVGRFGEAFLQETVVPISKASDTLILGGCSSAIFDHFGHDSDGHAMLFRTAKRSLVAIGHPSFAILGITSIQKILVDEADCVGKAALLSDKWNRLMRLDEDDRALAIMLAQGLSTSEIAQRRDVSKRTIENHRNTIVGAMGLGSQLELVKLLVRLQEKGFGDLGV